MTDTHRSDAGDVEGLVSLAREAIHTRPLADKSEWQIDRLTRTQRSLRGARVPRTLILGMGALGATAAALLLAFLSPGRGGPSSPIARHATGQILLADEQLSYVVQGESAAARTYQFSDGTSVSTTEGDALQILDTKSARPRLRVTRGLSHVRVIHRPDTHWSFAAGPFDVDVVGTEFDLKWDQNTNALTLRMHEGAVELRGPPLRGALRVRAGQTAMASARTGRVSLVEDAASRAPGPTAVAPAALAAGNDAIPVGEATLEGGSPPEATANAPSPSAALVEPPRPPAPHTTVGRITPVAAKVPPPTTGNWRTLVARGQFDQVIAEAQARPLKQCVHGCSSEDLRALGDAARYSNRADVAEQAYRALRQRFSGSSDGVAAAFLLGRTYESKRQWEQASRWYQRYLAEAAEGEFAVEAAAGRARVADDAR